MIRVKSRMSGWKVESPQAGPVSLLAAGLFALWALPAPWAEGAPASVLEGKWTFSTEGERIEGRRDVDRLNRKVRLTFEKGEKGGMVVVGEPFGFPIIESNISTVTLGGKISFKTTYRVKGQPVPIKWEGKLNREGTEITDGKFSFILGTGTFTAVKATGDDKKAEDGGKK
ncbi:MAG: hypothetical protein HYU36_15915 [Planctomycetes bacterium]|nr:hypothetical protein [Planctomycetota bacterium]